MRLIKLSLVALSGILLPSFAQAEPVKIRSAWVAPVSNRPSIVMEKKELARHLGKSYVFEPVRFQSTPLMITALANGEIEIGNLAFSSFPLAFKMPGSMICA